MNVDNDSKLGVIYLFFFFGVMFSRPPLDLKREFKKRWRLLQRKRELCDFSMLVKLYKIGEVRIRLFGTSVFCAKAENERFTVLSSESQVRKFHDFIWQTTSTNCTKKRVCTCCTIMFLNSTNQIIDLWCCRSRSRGCFLNSVILVISDRSN